MTRESQESLSYEEKGRLSDLELFRIAGEDDEAFVILTGRLIYIRHSVREWCLKRKLADKAFDQIADAAVQAAIGFTSRASNGAIRVMNRPDWFQRLAYVEFKSWLKNNQPEALLAPPAKPAARDKGLTPEERKARKNYDTRVRRCFDWIKIPEHRAIIERVMIRNLSPEEAGREMGMIPSLAIVVFYDAVAEVRTLMREHPNGEGSLAEQTRLMRCLARIESKAQRELLLMVFVDQKTTEEAGAEMGLPRKESEQMFCDALVELKRLQDDDRRNGGGSILGDWIN